MGNYGDCQKKYMTYVIEPGPYNQGFKLTNTSPEYIKNNLSDYLSVDYYRIYTNNYGEMPQLKQEGRIIPDVTIIYYPCEPPEYYEIRFYSGKCENNYEHYIYGSYSWMQCDMGQGLSIQYLQERKHSGGSI